MPKVLHLFRAPRKRLPMEALASATAVADRGFSGCAHARAASKRQILLVDRETLDAMDLHPGIIRENITTDGLNVNGLPLGQRLRVGATGEGAARLASRDLRTARHALPRCRRRRNSRR